MFIAKSYFYGENGFPVNYKKASEIFKLAADRGNSEAQWRYAVMLMNSIGNEYDFDTTKQNLQKSTIQGNVKGKFFFAFFTKKYEDNHALFEKLLKECCYCKYLDGIYYYALYLEKNDSNIKQCIENYKSAADEGHLDSLIQLLSISKKNGQEKLFEDYLKISAGIFNEIIMTELIDFYDKKKEFKQSNILIQIGFKLNYQIIKIYYINHLLYGYGMPANKKKAKELAILAFKKNYDYIDNCPKYIYILLQALSENNEHKEALNLLLTYKNKLSSIYRDDFQLFYKSFDKNMARQYFIPACFYYKKYLSCHDILMEFYGDNVNKKHLLKKLYNKSQKYKNPFVFAIIGKIYKQGKFVIRNLKKAIYNFERSAELKCPLGYYYIGKEYFYGRYLNQDYRKAKKFFRLALENNEEPRAGYYLFKIAKDSNHISNDDINNLKVGVEFGDKRSLYKYGCLLYKGNNDKIRKNESEGIKYIQLSSFQNYKKAIEFCKSHDISYKKDKNNFFNSNVNIQKKEKDLSMIDYNNKNDNNSIQNMHNDQNCNFHTNDIDESNSKKDKNFSNLFTSNNNESSANLNDISKKNSTQNIIEDENKISDVINNDDDSLSDLFGFWF